LAFKNISPNNHHIYCHKLSDFHQRSVFLFSTMSRLQQLMTTTPLATLCTVVICCLVFCYQVIDSPELTRFTLCARNVVYLHEFYRIISSGLFHGGFLHIGMNMMSTLAIGGLLERTYGTLQQIITILWGLILVPTTEILVALTLYKIFRYENLMYQNSVGFSGVLFQLSVLEANLNPHGSRSVFGFCQVSSRAYPWAMLLVLQFILPNVSFWGHLSGIVVGTLQLLGAFHHIMPSKAFLMDLEQKPFMLSIKQRPNFISTPSAGDNLHEDGCNPVLIRASLVGVGNNVCVFLRNMMQTISYIIYGNNISNNTTQGLGDIGITNLSQEPEENLELQAALILSLQREEESQR